MHSPGNIGGRSGSTSGGSSSSSSGSSNNSDKVEEKKGGCNSSGEDEDIGCEVGSDINSNEGEKDEYMSEEAENDDDTYEFVVPRCDGAAAKRRRSSRGVALPLSHSLLFRMWMKSTWYGARRQGKQI